MSFDPSGVDYYDVSVVNGVNVPMSVKPLGVEYDQNHPYNCGAPGKAAGLPSRMECSRFVSLFQKNMIYTAVYGGSGDECDSPDDCQDNEKCGYKYTADGGLGFYCGYRYGYYTGSQICALDPTNEDFQCAEPAGDDTGLTMADLYSCADPYISGYQRNAEGQEGSVCGCANWEARGINVFDTEKCQASNPVWTKKVAPTLDFLKKGCATALTYPYDEASSLFSCGGQKEYLVTFCPNGDGIRTHPPEHK
ncbi:hypothetical protein Poli38472_013388 [Pythium oligandrum]|uniref:Thaumatin-like protein n=1 Tax=Pythium oligandrum TaxID=41045 RepID=A0A8K1FEG3_PYTOL|nr:hypothetical protein Poli38472_013388 [Pythium oligandrum]|eukprot:TMW57914.1 hypothetical protein Poli38472_013388 [Pythium oligandrum]